MNLKTKVISRQHSYSVDTCYLSEKMFSKCFFPDSKNSYLARVLEKAQNLILEQAISKSFGSYLSVPD